MSGPVARVAVANRLLTAAEFHQLADVPPEVEWFANISNRHTRRADENAVKDFMRFTGIGCRWRSRPASIRRRMPTGSLAGVGSGGQRASNGLPMLS
jgi:hypothetical protein